MLAPFLESERLYYKPLSLEYASDEYLSWLNDPEVSLYLESAGNYTKEKLISFLQEVEKKEILFWAIHIKATEKHIGNIKIDPYNKKHNVAEYGIMMGDKSEWGKGYARETSETIIKYCFANLNLRKMTLGVVTENIPAVKLYESLGFKNEGIYIKQGLYNDHYCDIYRMALFNPSFD